jgi:outer membrane receptor protein involved in Fe transport
MKHVLLLSAFFLAATIANAQVGRIYGKIMSDDNQPVVGGVVAIKSLNKHTITDNNGNYTLESIPYGSYILELEAMEIVAEKLEISLKSSAKRIDIDARLREGNKLSEVNITGKTQKRTLETQGFAVAIVDTKEAAKRNLQTNELLDRTVGVRVRQSGGIGSSAVYNLNGMSGRSIGIFIDGIEISTYGSSFNLNNIPPAMIERIEVYKGVLPAHLSGDFLGGGINIVLKKDALRNSLIASLSYGSFNTQQANLGGTFRNAKNGFTTRFSGFYTYSDNDYEVWSKWVRNELPNGRLEQTRAKRFNNAFKSYGGRLETGFTNVKWADNFMVSYNGSDVYSEVQHGQYMTKPYKGRFTKSQAHVFGINYNKKNLLTDGLEFVFNGVYSNRSQYIQDTVSWRYNWSGEKVIDLRGNPLKTLDGAQQGRPTLNTIKRQIATFRSGLQYAVAENHRLALNNVFYLVNRSDYDRARTVLEQNYLATSDLSTSVTSLAYEMQAISTRLKTNLFAKHYQQNIDRLEPVVEMVNGKNTRVEKSYIDNRTTIGYGLATSFALKHNLILLASAEKAVRMASEAEIFGNQADNLLPNLNIRPEISNNFNLGIRAGQYQFGKHKLSLSASGFVRDTKDKIVLIATDRNVSQVDVTNSKNLNGTQAMGMEAELNYLYRKLNVSINASRFSTLLKDDASLFNNQQIPNEPYFTVNGNAQYRFDNLLRKGSRINLYYSFGYVKSFETIFQLVYSEYNVLPSQFIQDVGFSYMFPNKRFLLAFDAKNIFNKEAFDNFAAQKPGRAFYLKFNYTINNF